MYTRAKYLEPNDKKSWESLKNPVGTIKFDGANYFLEINSEGRPSYISRRQGVDGRFPNRTSALPQLNFVAPELAGDIYNIELIHTGFNKTNVESHRIVSGILNSLPPRAVQTQAMLGPIRAILHNVVSPKFKTYKEKLDHLKKVERLIGKSDLIFVPQVHIGHEAIKALIRNTKDRKQEGVIVTDLHTDEDISSRYKIKHKETYNVRVTGMIRAETINGEPKDEMGALLISDASGKPVGKVGTGFSRQERIDAFKNPGNWVGRHIQVETLGWAVNALRMPVYNGDADGDLDLIG